VKDIKLFQTLSGKKPFSVCLDHIKNKQDRARIRRRIDRLQLGHYGDCKRLNKDLYKLRLFFGPGYRVYFTEIGNDIVILLLGGNKNTQKKDIVKAQQFPPKIIIN